jgi:hypothetical protein
MLHNVARGKDCKLLSPFKLQKLGMTILYGAVWGMVGVTKCEKMGKMGGFRDGTV